MCFRFIATFIFIFITAAASPVVAGMIPGFYPGWQVYEKKPASVQVPLRASAAGGSYTDPTTGMEFVRVKGGCFQMGSNEGSSDEIRCMRSVSMISGLVNMR